MMDYSQGDPVWIDSFYGIQPATIVAMYPKKSKVVVERNGEPEIIDGDRVFPDEIRCCASAAMRLQNEIAGKMATVVKLSEKVASGRATEDVAVAT